MSIVSVQNDKDFLMDQREERKLMIGKKLDTVFVQKLKNKEKRITLENRRKTNEETRKAVTQKQLIHLGHLVLRAVQKKQKVKIMCQQFHHSKSVLLLLPNERTISWT